ncbi:MAG: ribosome biogenesis GTPase Der [Myxococcota bacterium]
MKLKVAIVGRANAGKSTLFNRLVGKRKAIVHNKPGVTRDRHYGDADYAGFSFIAIDTGGFEWTDTPALPPAEVRAQAEKALADANGVIFLVDGREPLGETDRTIAEVIRRSGKPVALAVNKIDGPRHEAGVYDYYELGVESVFPISALNGDGVEELIEALFALLPPSNEEDEEEKGDDAIPIAIVGKPNVGKSTLVNAILGYERTIVSEMPGTTRDAIDTPFEYRGQKLTLIDTAGIRRPSKVKEPTEYFSVQRALDAIDRAKAVIFLIDAEEEVSHQDKRIAGYAERRGAAAVIGVNKWDLVAEKTSINEFEKEIYRQFRYLDYAPIVTISAKNGQRVFTLLAKAIEVAKAAEIRVPTSLFNRFLEETAAEKQPPLHRGKRVKFFFGAQVGVSPPRFEIVVNFPEGIHPSYHRFLMNSIREAFGFMGSPIKLKFKKREQKKRA